MVCYKFLPLIFLHFLVINQLTLFVSAGEEDAEDILPLEIIDAPSYQRIKIDLLNKLSGKRIPLDIPLGSSFVVHDIRIEPHTCIQERDSFLGTTYRVPLTIYLEQEVPEEDLDDSDDPVELYDGELNTNPRKGNPPIEHALYDFVLKSCE